jgi:hypothetical protein
LLGFQRLKILCIVQGYYSEFNHFGFLFRLGGSYFLSLKPKIMSSLSCGKEKVNWGSKNHKLLVKPFY